MASVLKVVIASYFALEAYGFVSSGISKGAYRLQPVNENFFLDIAEDPVANTPKQIFGEAAYRDFVASYKPDALIVGGPKYDVIERIRSLKLLSATADSGLLEALEEKGVTLSQLEKLLPLADDFGVLPFAAKNKDLLLSVAPLLIEPAPALLPLVVSLIKADPNTYSLGGIAFLLLGVLESSDNLLLGAPLVLAGLPLIVLGSVLSTVFGVLSGKASISASKPLDIGAPSIPAVRSNRPIARGRPKVQAAPAPRVAAVAIARDAPKAASRATSAPKVAVSTAAGGAKNGQRKTVKVVVK